MIKENEFKGLKNINYSYIGDSSESEIVYGTVRENNAGNAGSVVAATRFDNNHFFIHIIFDSKTNTIIELYKEAWGVFETSRDEYESKNIEKSKKLIIMRIFQLKFRK